MSVEPDPGREMSPRAGALFVRAGATPARARGRLSRVAYALAVPEAERLDDRTRAAFAQLLTTLIETIWGDIVDHTARTLRSEGCNAIADTLAAGGADGDRLVAVILADPDVLRELDGRVRHDLLAAALTAHEREDTERPSLLPRLAGERDPAIADPAMAMLLALSRRAAPSEGGALVRSDLSAEAHHRLVWHVAAAVRGLVASDTPANATLDRAIVAAAHRSLAAHDEGIGLEASAARLAAALGSDGRGNVATAIEALGDRLLALFIAIIADGLGLEGDAVRDAVLDRDGATLWLMLRAFGAERTALGTVGLALATADPGRDVDALADDLDVAAAIDPAEAHAALASLALPAAYREALAALRGEP